MGKEVETRCLGEEGHWDWEKEVERDWDWLGKEIASHGGKWEWGRASRVEGY